MNFTQFSMASILIINSGLSCKPAIDKKETINKEALYQEKHRPQFHFSPPENWMNDPNGMVYYDGEYHLFYQYYPDSNVWGPMHWGHAVSTDMVRWENLPIALYPDSIGYIFSGSAVVDWKNTSGFGRDSLPPLVALYTYHDPKGEKEGRTNYQTQGLAYSLDKGRTWIKYSGNPVIGNEDNLRDIRDPKVFWHEKSGKWIMVLAAYDHIKLYGSKDLKTWTYLSDWGKEFGGHDGVWECPDLFEMVANDQFQKRWVLIVNINPGAPNGGSGTQYFIGDFDGNKFTLDKSFVPLVENGKAVWLDDGRDNYAGVTWSDIPASDGRRLLLGWMSNWDYAQKVPTEKWRSAMTVPREIVLFDYGYNFILTVNPVKELKALRLDAFDIDEEEISGKMDLELPFPPSQMELYLAFDLLLSDTNEITIILSNQQGEEYKVGFDVRKNQFFSDRSKAGDHSFSDSFSKRIYSQSRISFERLLEFHFYFDVASMELFADGVQAMTETYFPTVNFDRVSIVVDSGKTELAGGLVYKIGSIW